MVKVKVCRGWEEEVIGSLKVETLDDWLWKRSVCFHHYRFFLYVLVSDSNIAVAVRTAVQHISHATNGRIRLASHGKNVVAIGREGADRTSSVHGLIAAV